MFYEHSVYDAAWSRKLKPLYAEKGENRMKNRSLHWIKHTRLFDPEKYTWMLKAMAS